MRAALTELPSLLVPEVRQRLGLLMHCPLNQGMPLQRQLWSGLRDIGQRLFNQLGKFILQGSGEPCTSQWVQPD
jgi:hypothetical protein